MRADCKSVRQQIDEAEREWSPGTNTQEHLASCESCNSFYKQELRLREMVGGLGTVQAPPDFDFRLRARLASDKSAGRGIAFGGLSLGFRSAAFAALVVILGVAFLFRGVNNEGPQEVVKTNSPSVKNATDNSPSPKSDVNGTQQLQSGQQTAASSPIQAVTRPRLKRRVFRPSDTVAVNQNTVTKDFGSAPAEVIKHTDEVSAPASVFPIETRSESLKLSLDDVNGVSRTISLPRVSFGSQRFVAGDSTPVVKTTVKGVW